MKLSTFLLIVFMALAAGHHQGTHYGHCGVGGGNTGGHICFKDENGVLTADFHVTGVGANKTVKVHVHENPAQAPECVHAGKRFQGAHGNLKRMQANSKCVIHSSGRVLDGLSLSGETSILGRSVFIHLGNHINACCTVSDIDVAAYNRMVGMGRSSSRSTCH